MNESPQNSRLVLILQEIYEACKGNQSVLELAVANFQSLLQVMNSYEKAPKLYNNIIENGGIQDDQDVHQKRVDYDPASYPIANEFVKIYKRKLKQSELLIIAKEISTKTGITLDRSTKRSKGKLLQWYSINWNEVLPKITELGLDHLPLKKSNDGNNDNENQNEDSAGNNNNDDFSDEIRNA